MFGSVTYIYSSFSRFDGLQIDTDVSVVVISSSEGESSPAKFPKRTTDLDDAVSVHASFAKFPGDILSSVVCYMFSAPQLDAASVIAISSSEGEPSPEKSWPYQFDTMTAKLLAKRRRL